MRLRSPHSTLNSTKTKWKAQMSPTLASKQPKAASVAAAVAADAEDAAVAKPPRAPRQIRRQPNPAPMTGKANNPTARNKLTERKPRRAETAGVAVAAGGAAEEGPVRKASARPLN